MQPTTPIDRIVYSTDLVWIGAFRCPLDHPQFTDSGPIAKYCFVFPRSAVTIEHEHDRPFVANANVVTLYNRGERYQRGAISREGDRCDWFGVAPSLARDVLRAFDPSVDERTEILFPLRRSRSDAALYLRQRRIFEWATSGAALDALAVEERVVSLLERVAELSFGGAERQAEPTPRRARSDAIHRVERLLSERWSESLRLTDIGREVGLSPYHLCRTFRREVGTTLHQYRHQLRVRSSLESVRSTRLPLVEIALQTGFSSHSHFTNAFHREFGASPSGLRAVEFLPPN